jgi:hypothetical protein
MKEHIKTPGQHQVTLTLGVQSTQVAVEVKAEAEKAAKAA